MQLSDFGQQHVSYFLTKTKMWLKHVADWPKKTRSDIKMVVVAQKKILQIAYTVGMLLINAS